MVKFLIFFIPFFIYSHPASQCPSLPPPCIGGKVKTCECPPGTVWRDAECKPIFKGCFKSCLSCTSSLCQWEDASKDKFLAKSQCRAQRAASCKVGFANPDGGCAAFCDWKIGEGTCENTTCPRNAVPDPEDFCKCKQISSSSPQITEREPELFKGCFKSCLSCTSSLCQWEDASKDKFLAKSQCRAQRAASCKVGFANPDGGCAAFCDWKTGEGTCENTTCPRNAVPDPEDFCKCKILSRGVR